MNRNRMLLLGAAVFAAGLVQGGELTQLVEPFRVRNAGHPRVLILGNSVTRHGPKPSIGWTNDFGMAASSIAKDFAHVLAAKVKAEFSAASFALANVAGTLERKFRNGLELDKDFGWMRDVRGRFNHPSDNGMRMIAERFWDYLEPAISDKWPMHLMSI